MEKMQKKWILRGSILLVFGVMIAILAMTLNSCSSPLAGSGTTGSLHIGMGGLPGVKAINPPISMDCASYDVTITGSSSTAFTITEQTTIVENLLPGPYVVDVIGYNADPIAIGAGSNTVTVSVGAATPVTIVVEEYDGLGNYHLDLSWEPAIIDVPVISGVLKDWTGTDMAMVFTGVDPVLAVADSDVLDLQRGWYSNIVTITDDGVLSCGFADVVRIVSGFTTTADIFLHATEGHGGLDINIDLDFFDPLHFTGTPAEGAVDVYDLTHDFSVVEDDAIAFTGVWYLNGAPVDTGDSASIDGTTMIEGESYRLDFIGFSTDGKHAGAAHWILTKSSTLPEVAEGTIIVLTGDSPADFEIELVDPVTLATIATDTVSGNVTSYIPYSIATIGGNFKLRARVSLDGGAFSEWRYWFSDISNANIDPLVGAIINIPGITHKIKLP